MFGGLSGAKMFDVELMILAVQKYPCLWNLELQNCTRREDRDEAWENVAREMYPDWLRTEDKELKLSEIKKKWANVRDYYKKDFHARKSSSNGAPSARKKKYVYADILTFLDPVFDRRSHTNYESILDSNFYSGFEDSLLTQDTQDSSGGGDNGLQISDAAPLHLTSRQKRRNASQYRHCQQEELFLLEVLKQRQLQQQQHQHQQVMAAASSWFLTAQEDADASYLLSFVPEMREMSPIQKIDFKAGMLDLLRRVKFPDIKS